MAVITISREYGSEGTVVGKGISEKLNYLNVDKNMIGEVLQKYGMITFDKLLEERHNIWDRFDYGSTQMVRMLGKTMLAFASLDNCVIMGRGGFVVMSEYQNVLNVLIRAPFDIRVGNVLERIEAESFEAAERLVEKNDRLREDFLRVFYGVQSNDTDLYNLVIDTDKVSNDMAVRWICDAAAEIDKRDIIEQNSTLNLEVNRILADTVKSVIK